MSMSSYYQPLVIKSLVEPGGRQPASDLARCLLLEDHFATGRALRILMRWPRITLGKRHIAYYDKATREFVLPVEFDSDEQRRKVIDMCAAAIAAWRREEAPKRASQFYRVIERADGRCQACGIPASIRRLDIDHIHPKASSRTGMVTLRDGTKVPLHDERNLQALCTKCNRGRRDTSTYDFRPSAERLAETITLVLRAAARDGLNPQEILARATEDIDATGSPR
jgi:5-methylcytosine-specific restriction endonuclease McrA